MRFWTEEKQRALEELLAQRLSTAKIGLALGTTRSSVARRCPATNLKIPLKRTIRQTHCKRGHPLEPPNLYFWKNQRYCKTCKVANCRAAYQKKKPARKLTCGGEISENHAYTDREFRWSRNNTHP